MAGYKEVRRLKIVRWFGQPVLWCRVISRGAAAHAWDNTELGVPLWLWYSFLRTGRGDVFRLAEAHTRNTSETNVYSIGPMAGLGSRHNVVKWGCGSKEARISQAAHWRPYYYLTTDERTGDIMSKLPSQARTKPVKPSAAVSTR